MDKSGVKPSHPRDVDYAAIARATKQRVDWPDLLSASQWKWRENARNFAIYTREEPASASPSGGFSVLATGVIKGSVREIAALLTASSQREYERRMTAYHGKEFKRGVYITDVVSKSGHCDPTERRERVEARLSLRTATFAGSDWLRREEEWCYLDATTSDNDGELFERLLTSLRPEDVIVPDGGRVPKVGRGKRFRNLIVGYKVQPEESTDTGAKDLRGARSRVHFFAEIAPPPSTASPAHGRFVEPSSKHQASTKVTQSRMLYLARNCDRLSALVRRRRLGVQVLMDTRRVLSLSNRPCVSCEKVLLVAKLCRLCGHGVCKDCSEKYERETCPPLTGATRLDKIRVCDPCLARTERADYSGITDRSLAGAAVFPDRSRGPDGAVRSAESDLKGLLHNALVSASSPQRKDAVLSVIQCVVNQERSLGERPRRTKSSVSSTVSTASSTDQYYTTALDTLTLETIPCGGAELSCEQGRTYTLDPHNDEGFPVPDNEAERLESIENLGVLSHGDWAELDIICDLAAKEVGAFASIVSIITKDEQRVVAANSPHLRAFNPKRQLAFCTHTIMENKPLIVPHPEADYRLSHVARAWNVGVRFYCGFPLLVDGTTAIGTLCCVDRESHELTESQYTGLQRLAHTATKIIQLEAAKKSRHGVDGNHVLD